MKNLLSIESLTRDEIVALLQSAHEMKAMRGRHAAHPLRHQCWALIFAKSSTRTRVSFEVGVRELGGDVIFLNANDIQLGRGEPIKDTARVLGRMVHGAIIRTFAQSDVEEFAQYSGIPTINALTDDEHPCQILADLQTIEEKLGSIEGKTVVFVGDGAATWRNHGCGPPRGSTSTCGSPRPRTSSPRPRWSSASVTKASDHRRSRRRGEGADVLYTDVWVSMGKEDEAAYRIAQLGGYQINSALVASAKPGALVMHCLPAYRGKEITDESFEAHAQTIFAEAENRLHAQKAILSALAR